MRRRSHVAPLGALMLGVAVASCGDVPTLENGIAYISPVLLPSPAVAIGDTLRDSNGDAAPLRVKAFGRDSQEITGITATFLPTTLPSGVTITPEGYVIADSAPASVQLVARVGDRLQTTTTTLLVVPRPTSIARSSTDASGNDSAVVLPALKSLPVTVLGVDRNGVSTPVDGIIVTYRIERLFPDSIPSGRAVFTNDADATVRPDSTIAVDTTSSGGNASRKLLVLSESGVDSVFVIASAADLAKGAPPLSGSPVRFILRVKK